METGVVSEETLQTTLRHIGQRRRQGVLEVAYPNYRVEISFIQGKAVEAAREGGSPVAEVCAILVAAGLVSQDALGDSLTSSEGSFGYRELFLLLAERGSPVDEELFRRVIRQRVLGEVYSLDMRGSGVFTFRTQMVEVDRQFSPSISVGQILLDLVALPQNIERFWKVFPDGSWIGRADVPEGVLSVEERIVYDCLATPLSCCDLRAKAMLSEFHFVDGLLALYERGLIATQLSPIRPSSLSVRDMLHRTVVRAVEAGSIVESLSEESSNANRVRLQRAAESKSQENPPAELPADSSVQVESDPGGLEPELGTQSLGESSPLVAARRAKSLGSKFSLRALETAAAMQFIAVLFVLMAFAAPWLTWTKVLEFFAH